jgi:RNA polymerase sigma-70 factor (ECF subfamily)
VTDQDLIRRVLSGDPAAERQLYDSYVDQVWRMAYRFAGDQERAAEWTQDTFVRVFQRLRDFRGEAKLGTWIGAITISVALGGLRQGKKRAEREVPLDDELPHAQPGRPRLEGDLRQKLAQAIENLAEGYRSVFVLHDVEGYTHEEIAEMLGVTAGTSKAQLHRARGKLREALAAFA